MNKQLIALLAAGTVTSAMAGIELTGSYEGTISEGTGASTYAHDLDLTLVGSVAGATITATMEDLSGGETITTNELYVEATVEGLSFKGGKSKGQNGGGLLQAETDASNKMAASSTVGGFGVGIEQASGDSNATIDSSSSIGGIDITVQDMTNDSRFVTISTTVGTFDLAMETQTLGDDTNTGVSGTTNFSGVDFTGVYIDVENNNGVTQDDGILGDISNANDDSTVTGAVAVVDSEIGTLTGKMISINDETTYVGKIKRGVLEYGYSKTEDEDGVLDLVLTLEF